MILGVTLYTLLGLTWWWTEWRVNGSAVAGDLERIDGESYRFLDENEFLPTPKGIVRLAVRNVFGDPVPGAIVELNGQRRIAGEGGLVEFQGIPARLHTLKIEAEGYQPLELNLRVNEGPNEPIVKYDRGLFPSGFAVDFHVFYAGSPHEEQNIYTQVGWSNGTQHPVYIRWFGIDDQEGNERAPFLDSPEGYRRLSLMYTALRLATLPYALELRPQQNVTIDLPAFSAVPDQLGPVRLRILYGDTAQHAASSYEDLEFITFPVHEPDFNPHRP